MHYGFYEPEIRKSVYIPVATFVTSYARRKTITTSQRIRDYSIKKYGVDKYVYSDTDSIHCLFENSEELKDIVDIDDYRLGAWKHESSFTRAKFIRQKCYIEQDENDELNVTIAGLPKKLGKKIINFDNFYVGFTTQDLQIDESKLMYKHVKGGVVLVNTDFTIK